MIDLWKRCCMAILAAALFAGSVPAQVVYDGIILDRPNKWDGYPAHLFINGTHYIWWCSQGGGNEDTIWFSSKAGSLGPGGWATPQQVFSYVNTAWVAHDGHTCDPSVVHGSFPYQGHTYAYALYFTGVYNNAGTHLGGENGIGVAFSNNGLAWTTSQAPIINPAGMGTGGYGAGMSGVSFGPDGTLMQAYLDSNETPDLLLASSTDGSTFSPLPGTATQLEAAGRYGDGQGPDIAYNYANGYWYAVIKNTDAQGIYDGETRVLRALQANTLLAGWQVIGMFNSSNTSWTQNQNPGLGKTSNSGLYIDASGWAYVFFTVGNQRPDVASWAVAQGRFRP